MEVLHDEDGGAQKHAPEERCLQVTKERAEPRNVHGLIGFYPPIGGSRPGQARALPG